MPSMLFEVSVEMEGDTAGPWVVVADQRDVARWEVQPFGWPIVKLEEQASMLFFRFLGWSAATRQQRTTLTWDEFNEQCVEAMPVDDEGSALPADAEDPGRTAP
jgi:hypothetical protein